MPDLSGQHKIIFKQKRRSVRNAVRNNLAKTAKAKQSSSADVYSLRALAHAVSFCVESHFLTVTQSLDASSLKSGDVNEYVLRAAFWSDEAEALVLIEEFYNAFNGHGISPFPLSF
jgi:hypothetical protein